MQTHIYKTSRMLGKARTCIRKHPITILLPFLLRWYICEGGIVMLWSPYQGSLISLWTHIRGSPLAYTSIISRVIQIIIIAALTAYTILTLMTHLQWHIIATKQTLMRTLKTWPKMTALLILQYLLIGVPLYLGLRLFSFHLWRGELLLIIWGVLSVMLLIYITFAQYILVDHPHLLCKDALQQSIKLVHTVGRRKVANKAIGIIGMAIGILIISSVVASIVWSTLSMITIPFCVALFQVRMRGARTETYLTYQEQLPKKGDEVISPLFRVVVAIGGLISLAVVRCLVVVSLLSYFLNHATTTINRPLPVVSYSSQELSHAKSTEQNIQDLMDTTGETSMSLSAKDINAMIALWTGADRVVTTRIQDNLLWVDFSFPLSHIPQHQFANKYLYGSLGFSFVQGQGTSPVAIYLTTGTINNDPIQASLLSRIQKKNLLEWVANDPSSSQYWISQLSAIKIEKDTLVIQKSASK